MSLISFERLYLNSVMSIMGEVSSLTSFPSVFISFEVESWGKLDEFHKKVENQRNAMPATRIEHIITWHVTQAFFKWDHMQCNLLTHSVRGHKKKNRL